MGSEEQVLVTGSSEFTFGSATLANAGWLEWNEATWGVVAHPFSITVGGKELPRLTGVIYGDRRGRAVLPPLSPYLPLQLETTPTHKPWRLTSEWLDLAGYLAEELSTSGIARSLRLPPGLLDARPFQQTGTMTSTRYTYVLHFPYSIETPSHSIRRGIRKAQGLDYRVERSDDWQSVIKCLEATGNAQGFSYRLDTRALVDADKRMGSDFFRGYLVMSGKGEVVSADIILSNPGDVAIGWVSGTVRSHLRQGVIPLANLFEIQDLEANSATGLDLAGANIPNIAEAKAYMGGSLTPYLDLSTSGLMSEVRSSALSVLMKHQLSRRVLDRALRRLEFARARKGDPIM